MRAFIQGEPSAVIERERFLLLAGASLFVVSYLLDGLGIFTAFFLFTLGTSAAVLAKWLTERGLWMLAGLLLVIWLSMYALLVASQVRDIFRGAPAPTIALTIDFAIGTLLLSILVRFLWRVARENYVLTHVP